MLSTTNKYHMLAFAWVEKEDGPNYCYFFGHCLATYEELRILAHFVLLSDRHKGLEGKLVEDLWLTHFKDTFLHGICGKHLSINVADAAKPDLQAAKDDRVQNGADKKAVTRGLTNTRRAIEKAVLATFSAKTEAAFDAAEEKLGELTPLGLAHLRTVAPLRRSLFHAPFSRHCQITSNLVEVTNNAAKDMRAANGLVFAHSGLTMMARTRAKEANIHKNALEDGEEFIAPVAKEVQRSDRRASHCKVTVPPGKVSIEAATVYYVESGRGGMPEVVTMCADDNMPVPAWYLHHT
jgi:hypothetical protein